MPLSVKELSDCKPKRLWSESLCEWIEEPTKPKRNASQEEKEKYFELRQQFFALLKQTPWYFEKKEQERISRYKTNSNSNHVRRVRMKSATIEKVNPLEVFERDGWICQLCGYSVSKLMDPKLGDMASLDHIIPISKGGQHSYANTQLAHLSCNISKGNRV